MGDWPILSDGAKLSDIGTVLASSRYTNVYPNSAANTKGNWTQLTASTPCQANGFWLNLGQANQARDWLTDIAIGPAGSEKVIISNLLVSKSFPVYSLYFPLTLPAGIRIVARTQNTGTGSSYINVGIILNTPGFLPSATLSRCTTYGANEADSGGVSVDSGETAHTKGAWSEIVASTTYPVKMLFAIPGLRNVNRVNLYQATLFDIGIGAAGSEIVVVPNIYFLNPGYSLFNPPAFGPYMVNIPAGSRLVVRAQHATNNATDRLVDYILYGVD